MKILLLNDNPVVRKLVALSAQKTKDDLSVIWSVDEAEEDAYDLLIVDDAHYSDEAMRALKEKIQYKTSLLMATRGNAIPAGFDKVINKPFLPTDLVDLFSQIVKDIIPSVQEVAEPRTSDIEKAFVLDDTLEDDKKEKGFDITNLDDDLNLDDFDIEDEEDAFVAKTNVLDHEEVQELQGLLDETDNFDIEDEDLLGSLDDNILQALEVKNPEHELDDAMDEFDFDEELLSLDDEVAKPAPIEEAFDDDLLGSLDDLMGMDEEEAPEPQAAEVADEIDDLDALLLEGLDEDEESLSQEVTDDALSDDEFGELEQQIQEAVEELGIEDLAQGLDGVDMGDFEGFGELDGLSERDIKLAIGEEVEEEEPEVRIGHGSHSSLDAEALSEAMGESSVVELDNELEDIDTDVSTALKPVAQHHGTPAEGMDALQALLKALSNEEVAKTLKGLSINININFGNEK
ncbi:MAG: hypothetical protein PHV62_00800 [Sulfuricurvum sp.]|nr:hypothetical protein [Sulfuricurvum sp.]